ncbi:ImmA/IrrE family metallo-endopeptidase [Actinokineospora sp.]|uniref:ImmA/IrrE family metallo-endopeptidase n=1 Tax=Actinokineospora sp. TaxID=1872133 RepID=UPI0040380BBD
MDSDVGVAVVSRALDPGRRRATAAHELGHFVIGDDYASDVSFAMPDKRESVIDVFAAELLLPMRVVADAGPNISRDKLIELAAQYRTSWRLAVRQGVHAGVLDPSKARRWIGGHPRSRTSWMPLDGRRNLTWNRFEFRRATPMP